MTPELQELAKKGKVENNTAFHQRLKKEKKKIRKSLFENVLKMKDVMETQMKMLWHSAMPCFDLNGTTALEDGDSALLKMCFWKNVEIPCAAIFDKYPTDHGLCCSFNMQSANEIFHSGKFSETISKLQGPML